MPAPEAVAVLFAEEYRPEVSGQLSAVGVWPPVQTVEEFPWTAEIAPLIMWRDMVEEVEITLEIRSRGGAHFAAAQFTTGVEGGANPNTLSYLPLPPRRVVLSAPDIIEVAIRVGDGEEKVIGSMVILAESESAS